MECRIKRYLDGSRMDSLLRSCLYQCSFPEVSLRTINGEIVKNNDLLGKVLVIYFWNSQCVPTVEAIACFQKLAAAYYQNKEIVLLSVSSESWDVLRAAFPYVESDMPGWHLVVEDKILTGQIARFCTGLVLVNKKGKYSGYWPEFSKGEYNTMVRSVQKKASRNESPSIVHQF